MIENLEYFILLLPGFFIYITLMRLLGSDEKRDSLETIFFSLILSIFVLLILTVLGKYDLLTINITDWRFILWICLSYLALTIFLLFFFKKMFPWIERKTQIFDRVKSTTRDILYDVFDDKIKSSKGIVGNSKTPIWVHVLTKDGFSYTGNLVLQGLTKDNKEAIYIKRPKITNKFSQIKIDALEGLLIPLENIKWVGIIDMEYSKKK